MHDPMAVAFDVPAPTLRRSGLRAHRNDPRWGVRVRRRTNPENLGERTYRWWRPRGYRLFLHGQEYRVGTLATVWHVEPGGRDSGQVCPHYRRQQQADGTWTTTRLHGWRWHVHHWRIQVPALQELRRRLLTRCEWCSGPSRKRDRVNVSHQWDRGPSPWWRGDRGLYHHDCSSATTAARACTCTDPIPENDGYGSCARCSRFLAYGRTERQRQIHLVLQSVPAGQRPDAEIMAAVRRVAASTAPAAA